METSKIQRIGRFWLATTRRADGRWVAWAQTTPIYSEEPVAESPDCIGIASGCSREEVMAKLKRQLSLPPYDPASTRERHQCWYMLFVAAGLIIIGISVAQPILAFGGVIGLGHGIYACAELSERSEDHRS